jgi:hypothetical protein
MKGHRRKEKDVTLAQRFAQVFGIIYLVVGILGFIPPLVIPKAGLIVPPLGLPVFAGFLITLFAVNWLHSLAHLLIGLAGLATFRNPAAASTYALVIGVVYALLFILGLFGEPWGALDGLVPLNGWDNVLHLLTAVIALAAYYLSREAPAPTRA